MMDAPNRSGFVVGSAVFASGWAVFCLLMPALDEGTRALMVIAPALALTVIGLRLAASDLRNLALAHPAPVEEPKAETPAPRPAPRPASVPDIPEAPPQPREVPSPPIAAYTPLPHSVDFQKSARQPPAPRPGTAVDSAVLPIAFGPNVNVAFSRWSLQYRIADCAGVIDVPVQTEDVFVGRGTENHIVISHAEVSARHLRIRVLGDRFQVLDLGSSNGSALLEGQDGVVMEPRQLFDWPAGAEVVIPKAPPAVVSLTLVAKERR